MLLRYVGKASQKRDEHELKEILDKSFIEEDVMQDFIDKYIEQGMQQGIQQGMQQEGGKILSAQLAHRFGVLPTWVNKKIEEADVSAIEAWSIRIFSVSTIDEVFH